MLNTSRKSVAVLGVPFDNVSMDEAVSFIDDKIAEGGFHQIATANVDFLIHAIREKELQDILCSCDLVVPDGMPIVWAARMMGTRLKERVCGVDLVPRLAELAVRRGYGIYLLGACERSSAMAAAVLKERYPGLRIVGRYSPPLQPLEEMDHEDILGRIERAGPDILLVAMGNPKQERWLAMHRDRLRVPVCIGVGGSLDFLAGKVARAPRWMQARGLEWLHRTLQEPGRLAKRYLHDAMGLVLHLPGQLATTASQPRGTEPAVIEAREAGNSKVISIVGDFADAMLPQFDNYARQADSQDKHIIVDLGKTAYVGPDSLGLLIRLRTRMRNRNRQLWLAEPKPHLLRVLRTARLETYFMTTSSVLDAIHRAARAEMPARMRLAPEWSPAGIKMAATQTRLELAQDLCRRVAGASRIAQPDFVQTKARRHSAR